MKKFGKENLRKDLKTRCSSSKETWLALGFERDKHGNFRLVEIVFHPSQDTDFEIIHSEVTEKNWSAGLKSVVIYLLVAAQVAKASSANDSGASLVDSVEAASRITWVRACHSNVTKGLGRTWRASDNRSPLPRWRELLFGLQKRNRQGRDQWAFDGLALLCELRRTKSNSTPTLELWTPHRDNCIRARAILVYVFESMLAVQQPPDEILRIAQQIESQEKDWKPRVTDSFLRHNVSAATPPQTTSVSLPDRDTFINEKLERLGITRPSELYDEAFERLFGNRLIMHDAIVDGGISGYAGVPPERLRVTMTSDEPALPQYILDFKQANPQPPPNKRKIYLAGWTPPIIDSGHFLTLTLGHTDYWTNVSVQECRNRLHEDILKGNRDLFTLPRGLDVPMVVMTTNDQIAFCRRADHPVVRNCPLHWDVSIGEGVNADEDIDESGQIHPLCTLKRGLYEEMGIPNAIASEASIKFVAIATEWPLLLANLFAFVRLPIDSVELRNLWLGKVDQEHIDFDTADLNLDVCLNIVIRGTYQRANIPASKGPLHAVARLGLFAALCSHFSYQTVLERLDSM